LILLNHLPFIPYLNPNVIVTILNGKQTYTMTVRRKKKMLKRIISHLSIQIIKRVETNPRLPLQSTWACGGGGEFC